jgi:hypothetical protein
MLLHDALSTTSKGDIKPRTLNTSFFVFFEAVAVKAIMGNLWGSSDLNSRGHEYHRLKAVFPLFPDNPLQ